MSDATGGASTLVAERSAPRRRLRPPPVASRRRTAAGGGPGAGDAELLTSIESSNSAVQERTADLQRLKAEYDNYRRRVERDRAGDRRTGDRTAARRVAAHPGRHRAGARPWRPRGPVQGCGGVAEVALEALGLERFGAVGDAFDPVLHEALMHSYRGDVTAPTCVQVFRSGYSIGGRVLRAAQVVVAEPVDETEARRRAGRRRRCGASQAPETPSCVRCVGACGSGPPRLGASPGPTNRRFVWGPGGAGADHTARDGPALRKTNDETRRGAVSVRDMVEKDYYAALGVPKDAPAPRSRRHTASWPVTCTRTRTRATRSPRPGSRRSPRPTTSCPTSQA